MIELRCSYIQRILVLLQTQIRKRQIFVDSTNTKDLDSLYTGRNEI